MLGNSPLHAPPRSVVFCCCYSQVESWFVHNNDMRWPKEGSLNEAPLSWKGFGPGDLGGHATCRLQDSCGTWQLSLPLVRLFLGGAGPVLLQTLFSVCHRGPCPPPRSPLLFWEPASLGCPPACAAGLLPGTSLALRCSRRTCGGSCGEPES